MNGEELAASQQQLAKARLSQAMTSVMEAPRGKPTIADEAHEKARGLVAAYNRRVDQIRKDETLSDKGRTLALQQAYEEALLKVEGAKLNAGVPTHERTQELRRALFGLSPTASNSAVIAHRDAQDRVAQISKPDELGELMERAHAGGDSSLLRAGFAEAYRRSKDAMTGHQWEGLVGEYVVNYPDKQAALDELDALTNKFTRTTEMTRRMETSVAKPRELRR